MKADDRVRLLERVDGVPQGTEGVVLGFCSSPEGEVVAVVFGGTGVVVPPERLELLEVKAPRRPAA